MQSAVYAFRLDSQPVKCESFGHGHINTTLKVTTESGREYVLQKINTYVFKDPVGLMNNAGSITDHIRQRVEDPRAALHFMHTKDGRFFHVDENGEFWRMYDFVDGFSLDLPETEEDFYQSALAFGRFQELLSDFDASTLVETIPHFHDTIDRYDQFRASVEADAVGRAAGIREDIQWLLDREEKATRLERMRREGKLPLRVTHNDTKLNNVLLDKETRKSLCVLDLDTVMPGLSAYDFGDSIRFGAATAAEDEQDLSRMTLDLHLFEVYARGFLEAAHSLTAEEIRVLPLSAYTMAVELSTRFLKDYLDGDLYFRIAYPEHNLVRARSQMKLAKDMEAKLPQMEAIIARLSAEMK